VRLSQNFSFGKATLILFEKAGFRPLFRKPLPKLTGFWERLKYLVEITQNLLLGTVETKKSRKVLRSLLGAAIQATTFGGGC
jgi:hypothetical protein